ncbi:Wzz/FepE/Etk N-terminal domain-containing protein [Thalassotalea agariperforans]
MANNNHEDYSFYELLKYLWYKKTFLIPAVTIVMALTAIWSFTLPNIYRSQVLLSPTEDSQGSGLSSMGAQLGGLASIAGINLGNASSDKVTIALEIVKSRKFLEHFITKHNIAIPLFAGLKWDAEQKALLLDKTIYDNENKAWLRETESNESLEPSSGLLYSEFLDIFEIQHDKTSNLVTLSIDFLSPKLSKEWLDNIVADLNSTMRIRDIQSLQKSIEYLQNKADQTVDHEMKTMFFQLIQEQSKKLMIAEITPEYIFETLDPAFYPLDKSSPSRLLIILMSGLLVGAAMIFFMMLRFFIVPREN